MKIAVIQPHYDDAAFSVGELMLDRRSRGDQITIVTVFGGIPPAVVHGVANPHFLKWDVLSREHASVCRMFGFDEINLSFLDDAARGGVEVDDAALRNDLRQLLVGTGFDQWWVPYGIHHPDHVDVRFACNRIGRPSEAFLLYEELPYRVLYPPQVWLGSYRRLAGYDPKWLVEKRVMVRQYASQLREGEEAERCLWVPERLWEALL
jgi:LmbE family N-acetylglucosaminyl deacetylase